jgi:hypothetical protein
LKFFSIVWFADSLINEEISMDDKKIQRQSQSQSRKLRNASSDIDCSPAALKKLRVDVESQRSQIKIELIELKRKADTQKSRLRSAERKHQRNQIHRFSLMLGLLTLKSLSWQGIAGVILCDEDLTEFLNEKEMADLKALLLTLGAPAGEPDVDACKQLLVAV